MPICREKNIAHEPEQKIRRFLVYKEKMLETDQSKFDIIKFEKVGDKAQNDKVKNNT